MVSHTLWSSERFRGVSWLRSCIHLGLARSNQGTTLRASDLNNVRATILNPFGTEQATSYCLNQ